MSAAGWYDAAYGNLDNTQQRDREHAGQRPAGRRRAEPVHQALRQGAVRRMLDAFAFANFDAGDMPVNVKAASTPSTGATACCSAARSTASRTPRIRSTSGRGSQRRAAKRRSCSGRAAASRCRRSRRRSCRSPRSGSTTGRRMRIPESGSYLTIQDPLNFGGDSLDRRAESARRGDSRHARRYLRAVARAATSSRRELAAASATGACRRAGARSGSTARSASTTATRPTSCRRRWLTPGVAATVPAATCTRARRHAAAGGTLCFVNPNATTIADLQKFGKLGLYNGAYGDNIHIYGLTLAKNIAGVSVGRGAFLSPEHAAAERSGARAARAVRAARARVDRDDGRPDAAARRARSAIPGTALRQRRRHLPEDRVVRHGDAGGRADLDAVGEGHPERGGVQGHAAATPAIDKVIEELLRPRDQLHADLVPGVPGRRSAGADDLEPGHLRQCGGRCSAATRTAATGAPASPPTSTRSTASISSTTATTATIRPTRRRPAAMGVRQRRQRVAVRPRLGVADVQDHILTRSTNMFRKITAWPRASRSHSRTGALRRGVGRRGQAARHDADRRSAPKRPATRTARFPRTPAGITAAGRLQGGQRHPARSVRGREAAPRRSPARTWRRRPTS